MAIRSSSTSRRWRRPSAKSDAIHRSYHGHSFGYRVAQLIKAFCGSEQIITEAEAGGWFQEFEELERQGAYFFCSMQSFVAHEVAAVTASEARRIAAIKSYRPHIVFVNPRRGSSEAMTLAIADVEGEFGEVAVLDMVRELGAECGRRVLRVDLKHFQHNRRDAEWLPISRRAASC